MKSISMDIHALFNRTELVQSGRAILRGKSHRTVYDCAEKFDPSILGITTSQRRRSNGAERSKSSASKPSVASWLSYPCFLKFQTSASSDRRPPPQDSWLRRMPLLPSWSHENQALSKHHAQSCICTP